MEEDIGYKLIKSINLCFIYIQFFFQIRIFGFTGTYQERPGALQAPAGTELNEHKHPRKHPPLP